MNRGWCHLDQLQQGANWSSGEFRPRWARKKPRGKMKRKCRVKSGKAQALDRARRPWARDDGNPFDGEREGIAGDSCQSRVPAGGER